MPDTWEPVIYRERAKVWRERAALPDDDPHRAPPSRSPEGYESWRTSSNCAASWSGVLGHDVQGCRPRALVHLMIACKSAGAR
jgi:hypothetical protein